MYKIEQWWQDFGTWRVENCYNDIVMHIIKYNILMINSKILE